jgi:hypothetical protein
MRDGSLISGISNIILLISGEHKVARMSIVILRQIQRPSFSETIILFVQGIKLEGELE